MDNLLRFWKFTSATMNFRGNTVKTNSVGKVEFICGTGWWASVALPGAASQLRKALRLLTKCQCFGGFFGMRQRP
jgi:hypothetical protein